MSTETRAATKQMVPISASARKYMPKHIVLGDEALALGAIHAGVTAAYGYPGTPSTEILE